MAERSAGAPARRGRVTRRAGAVAGILGAGVGAAIAAERWMRRERLRVDPDAGERFGDLRGRPIGPVTSFDGTRLHVEEAGAGPVTIVFAHGFSLDLTTWHYQIRDLASSFRLVLYDQRGHGLSGMPPGGDFSIEALGRDLEAVLRAACPDGGAVVAGHSMGGMSALKLAEISPDAIGGRVAALALVDTTAADVMNGMLPGAGRRLDGAAQAVQEVAVGALVRRGRVEWLRRSTGDLAYYAIRFMGFGPRPSPAKVAFVERLLSEAPTEVWVELMRHLLAFDVRHVLKAIRVPTLVVVGSSDRLTPPGAARRIARAIPGAKLAVIPGAGHMSMLERPKEFNARLEAFVARVRNSDRTPEKPKAASS
ncbi:MAG: alpha/beta hydrolase [Acidobacteria bacterium]|nr:alpha/beta hydrolase [Acidobacteriota bacterium]